MNDLDAPRADARRAGSDHRTDDHPLQRGKLARHRNHRRADGLQAASRETTCGHEIV
ncbi:MAG: hypothetical protein ACLSVD_09155 [Eggerthellaceae bacterium]